MTDIAVSVELKNGIELFSKDRTIKQVVLMKKHGISRNTLKNMLN